MEQPPSAEPAADYDSEDPAYYLEGESVAADEALIAKSPKRTDYRVSALTPDLAAAAHRVGAPDYEAVFRDAQALFAGGRPPRDEAARRAVVDTIPDDAYAALQYRRATNLALILGAHVAAHRAAFVAD